MTISNFKIKYIDCGCSTPEHVMRLSYFTNDKDFIYVETLLIKDSLPRRVWVAIKHIFGYKASVSRFQETLLDKNAIKELKELIEEFEKVEVNDNSQPTSP